LKNILVTGGAGYIGAHTCKELAKAGFNPITLDNLKYGHRSFVKWGPLIEGDIGNQSLVRDVIQKYRVADIIHFAAYAYVGESVENPRKYYENNVGGSLSLLGAAIDCGVRNIVFSSTCATYGSVNSVPIKEETPQRPVNPYGFTKLVVENALRDYAARYQVNALALRYFNAAGADPDHDIGESHNPETHLIPLALRTIKDPHYTLKVFGDDYDTSDGSCVRDYIHVSDLANAHVKGLLHLRQNDTSKSRGLFDALNLGTTKGTSVLEVIRKIEEITTQKVRYEITDRRQGDPPILIADASKADIVLNWRPQYSTLDNIIRSAWEWSVNTQF
jgi:UDP-glucose-4-epimerase GalE